MRREQDLVHINHQVREVNAAFREVDELVTKQGEVIGGFLLDSSGGWLVLSCRLGRSCSLCGAMPVLVEIEDNTADAQENVGNALDNVRQADHKKRYCACSKTKLICCGLFAIVVAVLVLTLVLSLK